MGTRAPSPALSAKRERIFFREYAYPRLAGEGARVPIIK